MKRNIINLLVMVVLIFFTIQILLTSSEVMSAVEFSFSIWKNSIFPSLFPFFVISQVLVNYGFVELVSELFKPFMNKVFKVSGSSAYVFIMSLISGFPSSAKYVREIYIKGLIDEKEGTKILMFTHFSNPLFILGTISLTFLNNKEVGLLILLSHYVSNLIIGLIFRNLYPNKNEKCKFSLKNSLYKMNEARNKNSKNFGEILSSSIIDTINTLLLILGTVTIFLIITTIIDKIINISPYYQAILNGIVEMTQGLKYISILDIPLKLKTIISVMFISFGGISVHTQIISILSDTKIKYLPFLLARILHALISGILVFILFEWWF